MLFLVLVGSFFANINVTASIIPKNEIERNENKFDDQVANDNVNDFGYEIILEIDKYFRKEADFNNFKISKFLQLFTQWDCYMKQKTH